MLTYRQLYKLIEFYLIQPKLPSVSRKSQNLEAKGGWDPDPLIPIRVSPHSVISR